MISNKWTPEDYRTPAIEQKSVSGKAVSLDKNKKCWHKKKNALKARLSVTRNSYFDAFTADTFYLMATEENRRKEVLTLKGLEHLLSRDIDLSLLCEDVAFKMDKNGNAVCFRYFNK